MHEVENGYLSQNLCKGSSLHRDVTTGVTGATAVTQKFSDALTLFQPRGADSAQHGRGRTKNFPLVTFLIISHQQNYVKAENCVVRGVI